MHKDIYPNTVYTFTHILCVQFAFNLHLIIMCIVLGGRLSCLCTLFWLYSAFAQRYCTPLTSLKISYWGVGCLCCALYWLCTLSCLQCLKIFYWGVGCLDCAPCVAYNGFRFLIGVWVVSPGPCALRLSCLGLVLALPCLGCLSST